MSNPILRRFVRANGNEVAFWNIYRLRAGSGYVIAQGEDSNPGTLRPVKLSSDRSEAARCTREMEEHIQQRLAEGFTDITDAPWHGGFTSSLRTSLEEALVENPEDLAAHMAYADHLADLGDPRGEFIQVQLALENEDLSAPDRQKLQQREMALLSKYQRNWLGPMAGFWLDKMDSAEGYHTRTAHQLTWRRGWIDGLWFRDGGSGVQAALQWSAMLRCLRELRIVSGNYSDDRHGYGDLSQANFFRNVRILQIGPDQSTQNYFGETTEAADYYDRMPFLEELHIYNGMHNFEDAFPHLRRLTVHHYASDYPMAVLANNASLRNLTHLALWPRGMSNDAPGEIGLNEDGGYARISRTGATTLFRSPYCSHVEHLVLRNSDIGDEGLRVMIETGWLRRLKTLDLLGGCVTDVGARLLAENPDYGHLESLNLSHNMLTQTGIAALLRPGLALVAEHQHGPEAFQMYEYLYEGDCE